MSSNKIIYILSFILSCHSLGFTQTLEKKTNTQIADSLDATGEYVESLTYREQALKENKHSQNYQYFLQAKWHYTQSCIYETTGGPSNHKKALEHSLKAREIYNTIKVPDIWFNHLITKRIYHQNGYSHQWKTALIEAQKDLKILRDSLPESNRQILLVLDDIGFINNKLGDFSNSLKYYDKALHLYLKNYKENKKDIALNYNQMANNYRQLGMRKKELATLLEIEKLWSQIPGNNHFPLFRCYEQLSFWNTYYGNYELAETYLNKQSRIIDSIKHKQAEFIFQRRKKYLGLYKNYIELNLNKKDYVNAEKYILLVKNELKGTKREFSHDVEHEALNYFFSSKLPQNTPDKSITLIKKAIDLTNSYKEEFYLDPTEFKIALFKKYLEIDLYNQAENVLREIISSSEVNNEHQLFFFYTNYAYLLSKSSNFQLAEYYFKKALNLYLLENDLEKEIGYITINHLKPFYSFESIDGIVLAANFYLNRYINTNNSYFLESSQNLFFLASDMFSNLYLGERYNDNLFNTYKTIEKGLINVLELNTSENNIAKTLEAIENNASKLTWSKFLYSKEKPSLNIPDSIIAKENDLKTLINHYQNALYTKNASHQLESDTLQHRISDLNLELKSLQESIKADYSKYYNFNNNFFNLSKFSETHSKSDLILKYLFVGDQLYCFLISNSKLDFIPLKTSKELKSEILDYTRKLSIFNSDYVEDSEHLKSLIFPKLNKNVTRITIIPDDVLNYLPFDALFFNHRSSQQKFSKYSFSYSSSLTLLNEQNSMNFNNDNLKVGLFSSANNTSMELPNVSKEINGILNYFEGKNFNSNSKASFLKEAKTFNILHLAMHSNINIDNPEFSSLDFGNDKLLISELYHESFNAELAVLSACDTGNGNILKGEGVQSISKAFTYAGIPSTVVSLWKVDDEATSIIMTAFYKHLKKGESKDVALKNAKLDYLNSTTEDAFKHPYYWAGFIITGNTSPLVINNQNYLYAGIASIGFIALFFFRKKLQFF